MAAQTTITPHQTLSAADSAAAHLTQAAAPQPGVTPTGGGGASATDAAAQAVALKVSAQVAQMEGELAGTGPATSSTTQEGVAKLQQVDQDNAQALRAVGQRGTTSI